MPAAKPTTTTEKPTASGPVASFSIEADHPTNSDLLIRCIPNCKLRSALNAARTYEQQNKDGSTTTRMLASSVVLGPISGVPGMQLHINPIKGEVRVVDPLTNKKHETDLDRLTSFARAHGRIGGHARVRGVPTREEKLDKHTMKTLCRELWHIVTNGQAKVVDGELPEMEAIDKMEGNYLANPGLRVQTTMPRFEKDMPAWIERMHSGAV